MRQIRVQDATNRLIRQRLAISLRQEVPFGQRCQSYICRRTRTPDSVGCIHFGNPTPMRLCLRKELLASPPISVSTLTRVFTTPYPINSTAPRARPFLVPRYQLKKIPLCPAMFAQAIQATAAAILIVVLCFILVSSLLFTIAFGLPTQFPICLDRHRIFPLRQGDD